MGAVLSQRQGARASACSKTVIDETLVTRPDCRLTGTLVLHTLIIGNLWRDTAVRPALVERNALTVDIAPSKPRNRRHHQPRRPIRRRHQLQRRRPGPGRKSQPPRTRPVATAAEPALILPDPVSPSLRLEQSRVAVAAEIAKENAPKRRAFAGRSIDAMLPGADTGKLPGFRPQTVEESNGLARQIGQMLSAGVFPAPRSTTTPR